MGELLDNFLKVYQLANFIKHSRLQEERLRQQMEDERADRFRRNQEYDLGVRMRLEDAGATQVQPIGDIQPGFGSDWLEAGKKRQVTVPEGITYQVPTFEQRQQRLLDKIRTEGEAKAGIAIGQAAASERVRQQVRAEFAKAPNLHFNEMTQGDDLIIIGSDPQTGEERSRKVIKGAGKGSNDNVILEHFTDGDTRVTRRRDRKTGEVIGEERTPLTPEVNKSAKTDLTRIEGELRAAESKADQLEEAAATASDEALAAPKNPELSKRAAELDKQATAARIDATAKRKQFKFLRKRGGGQTGRVSTAPSNQSSNSQIGKIVVTPDGRKIRIKRIENGQITEYEEVP